MTRKKLARSSQCIVEYVGYTVFMSGMPDERARAKEYLDWLFDQLRGPVYVDNWEERDDVTMRRRPAGLRRLRDRRAPRDPRQDRGGVGHAHVLHVDEHAPRRQTAPAVGLRRPRL